MIRKAEERDKPSIRSLFKEVTGENVADTEVINRLQVLSSNTLESLFVYEFNEQVVGAMGFKIRKSKEKSSCYGEISILVISERYQKKGLGKQFMDFAETIAVENNCFGTWLVSGYGGKEKGHEFYKSLGYIPTGHRFIKHGQKQED